MVKSRIPRNQICQTIIEICLVVYMKFESIYAAKYEILNSIYAILINQLKLSIHWNIAVLSAGILKLNNINNFKKQC